MVKATVIMTNAPLAIVFTAVAPILARMSNELAHSANDAYLVKMVVGVAGIAMVLGAPIAGFLADRFNRGHILLGAGLVFAASGIAPMMLDSLGAILVARFVTGMAAMSFGTVGATIVGDYFDAAERARWMGALVSGALLFSLIGVPIAGFIGDLGWRWPFLLYLVGVPIALVAWMGIKHSIPLRQSRATVTAAGGAGGMRFPFGLFVIGLFIGIMIYVPRIYVPFLLQDLDIKNPSSVGLFLTLESVAGVVLASQFGRMRAHFTSRTLFYGTFAAAAAGVAAMALAPTFHMFFLVLFGLFLMGVGVAWLSPNILALVVTTVEEDRRGRTMGLVRAAEALAPAVGVTALEPLVRQFGVVGVLLILAALLGLMAAFMAIKVLAALLMPLTAED
jgi:MFS family permease